MKLLPLELVSVTVYIVPAVMPLRVEVILMVANDPSAVNTGKVPLFMVELE